MMGDGLNLGQYWRSDRK